MAPRDVRRRRPWPLQLHRCEAPGQNGANAQQLRNKVAAGNICTLSLQYLQIPTALNRGGCAWNGGSGRDPCPGFRAQVPG